jgi:2',3'-cyclic-nucleotide 2'-phosphodiesterase (5'-nucleotidase family)
MPVDTSLQQNEIDPLITWSRDLLSRHLGQIDPRLQISAEDVRWGFQNGELALSNFICDALFEQLSGRGHDIDFVMLDISSIQCGFQDASWVTFEDCFQVMPFLDTVRFYRLTGSQLIKLLQDNARRFGCQEGSQEQRGFLQFSKHIRYSIQKGKSQEQNSVIAASWQGEEIETLKERSFTAAATCFTRVLSAAWEEGNLTTPLILETYPFQDTQLVLRHEVISFLTDLVSTGKKIKLEDGRLIVHQEQ